MPRRFETGCAAAEFPATVKDHFRRIYFEALDLLVQAIADRFDQPGYRMYSSLQVLFLKATKKEDFSEELKTVCTLYGSDLHAANLRSQLEILSNNFSSSSGDIVEVKNYIQQLTASERDLMKEVVLLKKLTLLCQQRMPPMNLPLVQCVGSSRTFDQQ